MCVCLCVSVCACVCEWVSVCVQLCVVRVYIPVRVSFLSFVLSSKTWKDSRERTEGQRDRKRNRAGYSGKLVVRMHTCCVSELCCKTL